MCWELLRILKDEAVSCKAHNTDDDSYDTEANFAVRGCHSTIDAVILPPWLPHSVTEKMLEKFQSFLCKELSEFISSTRGGEIRRTHRSNQSSSAISVASTDVGASEDDSDYFSSQQSLENAFRREKKEKYRR